MSNHNYSSKSIIERWRNESNEGLACEVTGNINGLSLREYSRYEKLVEKYKKWIAPWLVAWIEETKYCQIEDLFNMDDDELCALVEKAKISLNPLVYSERK